jgi:cyclopropane-fatty-acyl-phospholipid synthase
VFNSPNPMEALLIRPSEIRLDEAFIAGDIDIEGDLLAAFDVTEHVFQCPQARRRKIMETLSRIVFGIADWWNKGARHSLERDRSAISHHYDQPADFYRLWLGESLVYSCAYFHSDHDDLALAQANKLELICRKLRLRPDHRFLDIRCGWGSLVLHAASRHNVYAQGITISQEQAAVAASRIQVAQLTQSCRVDLLDYRKAPACFAQFDEVASLGMFEHVGVQNLSAYFRTVHGLLKPGGVLLNHGIARAAFTQGRGDTLSAKWIQPLLSEIPQLRRAHNSSLLDKYVFPDGELSTISEALRAAESAGFEVRDVENLREHYERTLHSWLEAFQGNANQILRHVSEVTYRTWLLYMARSAAAFRRGDIAVYQALLSRPDHGESRLPLTRGDWYVPASQD